ncbi:aminoglycoside phosphotransferase family protein [Loktanella sp. S4079]|uniref:aminoglycoside phosphotransferase family protein n=1 Tax=Loktanella sp. S4079 TaxID=579483 RepID=UPI0005F9CF46|nr:phosphotransferase [Loktanella sp. S4079]KJZ19434.1 hypothetical protein TW80_11795 [Loktanella sp. S4079]
MMQRSAIIDKFIANSAWADWTRTPLAGDASGRRYERLTHNGQSVILMDDAPENGASTSKFAQITQLLIAYNLTPPEILEHEPDLGIMVLSDLGAEDFAHWLSIYPDRSLTLYRAAADVLVELAQQAAPRDLQLMTPEVGAQMVEITCTYYAQSSSSGLIDTVRDAMERLAPDANTLALRDYHAENLIWRPDQTGLKRVGLLDYQDAFVAPAGYDLASLLRDVRREIDPALAQEITTYFMAKTKAGKTFPAQLACLGAQRNLRILGVFARLASALNKPRYVNFIPRVWDNLLSDLRHPELKLLDQAVRDTLPAPENEFLTRLRG